MADIKTRLIMDTSDAKKGIDKLSGAFKALVAGASIQQFVKLGDEFTQITNRLKSVSDSTGEASRAFNLVKQVASDTRSDLGSVADLFTDLTIATEEMGLSQQQVAGVAGTFSKALKISGADANASAGAIRQFGQALASGVLRGDEFNSIMEANPAFMRAVAGQLDVNVGKLREMAAEGKLTSDVLVKATQEISGSIDEDFGKTVATVGESFTMLRNEIINLIGTIQEKTGIFTLMADAIGAVANNLDIVAAGLAGVFAAAMVGKIMAVVKAVQAFRAANQAAAASAVLLQAVTGVGLVKVGVGLAAAGVTLGVMNTMFDETAETTGEIVDNVDKQGKSSKDLLDNSTKQKEIEKQKKTELDEQLRIAERQKEEFDAITSQLQLGSAELQTQLDLQNDLLFASEDERDVINAIADIEADRTDALRDLAALTTISNAERLAKEKEINEEYDERIRLTEQQLKAQQRVNNAVKGFRLVQDTIGKARSDALIDLAQQEKIIKLNTKAEREAAELSLQVAQGIFDLESDLTNKLYEMKIAFAEENNKKVKDLTKDEIQALKDKQSVERNILQSLKENYADFTDEVVRKFSEMREVSRTFGAGFKEAFIEFEDQVTNSAEFGRKMFETMSDGWTDAILTFVETGKLSFKDLFKTLLVEIIKMQANRMFLALFSPTGGIFGDLFAGFFANGGHIPAGQVGIAGESGPELISGPATVTSANSTAGMLGGSTYVTYNINALDSRSFEQRLSERPEFIFALTEAGRRKIPGRL